MAEFNAPQSRNEAILQNILGATNELGEPESRVEEILQAILYDEEYTADPQSAIEELLLAIKNDGTYDKEAQSRNEAILIAKLHGEEYTDEPQSRMEELLMEWTRQITFNTTDTEAYSTRETLNGERVRNTAKEKKIVGGTVLWNQLAKIANGTSTINGVTFVKSNDGTVNVTGTATDDAQYQSVAVGTDKITRGNKILITGSAPNASVSTFYLWDAWTGTRAIGSGIIFSATQKNFELRITVKSGYAIQNTLIFKPQLLDLTQMFGSTIADYIYSLEQATEGAGVAWFKRYFPKDYYPYDAGSLKSTTLEKKVVTDGTKTKEYAYGSDELRGLFELDETNKLVANGDEKTPDGEITRKYSIRAYESGDETLANVITDGTNTVYKLATPTTEQGAPYIENQTVYNGGTETYVDANDLPTGHETEYAIIGQGNVIQTLLTGGAIQLVGNVGNLYTAQNCEINKRLNSEGEPVTAYGEYITDYMPCSCENGVVVLRCLNLNTKDADYPFPERLAYYDENKTLLGVPYCGGNTTYTEKVGNYLLIYIGTSSSAITTYDYISNIRYIKLDLKIGTDEMTENDVLTTNELCITPD